MTLEARRKISNEQVQNETSDRNTTLLTSPVNTIRSGIGLAGRFDGDVVVTSNLFRGEPVRDSSASRARRTSTRRGVSHGRVAPPHSMKIFPLNRRPWSRRAWGKILSPLGGQGGTSGGFLRA